MRTLTAQGIEDAVECTAEEFADIDYVECYLKRDPNRLAIMTAFQAVVVRAQADGMPVVLRNDVADAVMAASTGIDHTYFVGGVECNDCRDTFFLRKNGTHCPSCKGLL